MPSRKTAQTRNQLVWRLVDWLRDNPSPGWYVDTVELGCSREMTVGGSRWRIRHELSVGWNGYYLVFSVSPAHDLTLKEERRLRARCVYQQIESRISDFGYEGGWVVYDQIYGRWQLLVTDLTFALQEMQLLPNLRFPKPRNHGSIRQTPQPAPPPKGDVQRKRRLQDAALIEHIRSRSESSLLMEAIVRRERTAKVAGVRCGINVAFILDGPPQAPVEVTILPWAANARGARSISRRMHRELLALGYQGEPVRRLSFAHDGGPDYWHGDYSKVVAATPEALEAVRREVEAVNI